MKINTDLLLASDSGFMSVLVQLNLRAVFDTVDNILLQKLELAIDTKDTALL